jgi:hypothetical protein
VGNYLIIIAGSKSTTREATPEVIEQKDSSHMPYEISLKLPTRSYGKMTTPSFICFVGRGHKEPE